MFKLIMISLITLAGLLGITQKGLEQNRRSMQQKTDYAFSQGEEINKQMNELSHAQALYFKTYKQYPTGGIDELIAKGFLRTNFKTTTLSQNIYIDANNTINTTDTTNSLTNEYVNVRSNSVKANDAKNKAFNTVNENVESFLNNL